MPILELCANTHFCWARSYGNKMFFTCPLLDWRHLNLLKILFIWMQLLEWWYTSGEQRLGSQKNTVVPPPPPLLGPHPDGIALPKNAETCPLCRRTRTNPAMAVPSGYVFCYPCIFDHVSHYGCCPVTRLPAHIDQIRRLYQSQ